MNLHAFIRASHRDFTGVEFRHRRLHGGLHPGIFHCGSAHGQQAGGVNFRRHVRQLPLYGLEIADRFAKLFALLGILERGFVGALRHAQPQRGNRDATAIENAHGVNEPVALLAQ